MHNINYSTYKENVNRNSVQAEWDDIARYEGRGEGSSGLPGRIRWIEKDICDDYESAYNYIEQHDNGWYDQLAVRYRTCPDLTSKTYETLKERSERLQARYVELKNNNHYKGAKSQFIGCKECGSKISREYYMDKISNPSANFCPVCKSDLRPASTLEIIDKAKQNADKALKDFRLEEKKLQEKQKKKATIMWLVKTEYHT